MFNIFNIKLIGFFAFCIMVLPSLYDEYLDDLEDRNFELVCSRKNHYNHPRCIAQRVDRLSSMVACNNAMYDAYYQWNKYGDNHELSKRCGYSPKYYQETEENARDICYMESNAQVNPAAYVACDKKVKKRFDEVYNRPKVKNYNKCKAKFHKFVDKKLEEKEKLCNIYKAELKVMELELRLKQKEIKKLKPGSPEYIKAITPTNEQLLKDAKRFTSRNNMKGMFIKKKHSLFKTYMSE